MVKTCEGCGVAFYGRWRNDPAICPICSELALCCPRCQQTPPPRDSHDPRQLPLPFDQLLPLPPLRVPDDPIDDRYVSFRYKASQATRRKYPYC